MKELNEKKKVYYHYCSIDTFFKIIDQSTIRLSNPYKMNDTKEYSWLLNLLPEVVEEYIAIIEDVHEKERYKEFYVDLSKQIFDDYYYEKEPPYIACFSKEGDILSQWRSYADKSRGVAIGFCLEEIVNRSSIELVEVEYGTSNQKKLLLNALKESGIEDSQNLDFGRMKHMFTASTIVLDNILCKSIGCKNPAFKEENEVRLVYEPNGYHPKKTTYELPISDIQFRNDREKLISYFELNFSEIKNDVIKEIYIGSNSKLNDNDLRLFLESRGYDLYYLDILPTKATYR